MDDFIDLILEYIKPILIVIALVIIIFMIILIRSNQDNNNQYKIMCYRNSNVELELSGKIEEKGNYIVIKDNTENKYNININRYDYCKLNLISQNE